MTIPVSTVPAALTYLYAAIAAQVATDPNPGNIYLCMGDPGVQDPPDIIQVVAGVSRAPANFALVGSGGSMAMEEKYSIQVKVSSAARGDTEADIAPAIMLRAWQLVSYVETAVRLDPSFGELLIEGWPKQSTGGSPTWSPDGQSWMLCEISVRIDCEAVI